MNLTEINQFLPWFVILLSQVTIFVLAWISLRLIKVIEDNTLAKAPSGVVPKAPDVVAPIPAPKPCPPTPAPAPEPTPALAIDQGLVDFIKKEEGFEPVAKWDYKQYTNGYGTRAKSSTEVITEVEAERRLREEISAADALVTKRFPNLPKGQHQALLDLTYNAGSGWENGSLGKAVSEQKIDTIKADLLLYNHAGGQVLAGLTARREAEVAMIDNPL